MVNRRNLLLRRLVHSACVLSICASGAVFAQERISRVRETPRIVFSPSVSISNLGVPVTENFDTLLNTGTTNPWTDDSTLAGWYAQYTAVTTNPTQYRADNGSTNSGAIYSYGTTGSTERAFGSLSSGTPGTIYIALKLTNNTGSNINSLTVAYTGEQWRDGGATAPAVSVAQTVNFQYQVAAAGVITDANAPTTGWTNVSNLNFTTPVFGATTPTALDGNLPANRTLKTATFYFPTPVLPGQEIWLRWEDINDLGNDHGWGIDDLSVTASATTASAVSVAGRVISAEGRGIRNAFVTISGGSLQNAINVRTGPRGEYAFSDIPAGQTYTVSVAARRFSFDSATLVISTQDNVSDLNFIGTAGGR